MGRHSGAGFHFEFLIIVTIGPLPLGGCVIKDDVFLFGFNWGGYDRDGSDGRSLDMSRIGLWRKEVD